MNLRKRATRYLRWREPGSNLGEWDVGLEWVEVEGQAMVLGIQIRSYRESDEGLKTLERRPREITTSLLRAITVPSIIERNRKALQRSRELFRDFAADERTKEIFERDLAALKSRDRSKGGRPVEHGPEHFRRVAAIYKEAGRHPTKAVAEHFDVERSTAAKWVAKAREKNYLGDAPGRGLAGQKVPSKPKRGKSASRRGRKG